MHSTLSLHTFEPAAGGQSGFCYLLAYPKASRCVLIDPVDSHLEQICAHVRQHNLCLSWILHTRLADCQMASAAKLKSVHICAQSAIADCPGLPAGKRQEFDRLLQINECIQLGSVAGRAMDVRGENCGQSQYLFDRFLFSGDSAVPAEFTGANDIELLPRQSFSH